MPKQMTNLCSRVHAMRDVFFSQLVIRAIYIARCELRTTEHYMCWPGAVMGHMDKYWKEDWFVKLGETSESQSHGLWLQEKWRPCHKGRVIFLTFVCPFCSASPVTVKLHRHLSELKFYLWIPHLDFGIPLFIYEFMKHMNSIVWIHSLWNDHMNS